VCPSRVADNFCSDVIISQTLVLCSCKICYRLYLTHRLSQSSHQTCARQSIGYIGEEDIQSLMDSLLPTILSDGVIDAWPAATAKSVAIQLGMPEEEAKSKDVSAAFIKQHLKDNPLSQPSASSGPSSTSTTSSSSAQAPPVPPRLRRTCPSRRWKFSQAPALPCPGSTASPPSPRCTSGPSHNNSRSCCRTATARPLRPSPATPRLLR